MNSTQHNINNKSNLNLVALLYNNGYQLIISQGKKLIHFFKEDNVNGIKVFTDKIKSLNVEKFETAKILINTPKNTFVPNTIYTPILKKELFNLNFEETSEENIATEILSLQKLVGLYEFTNQDKAKIVSIIPNARFFNSNSVLIENLMNVSSENGNIVSITGNAIDIIIKNNSKLKLHCTNTFSNNDELLYFISLNLDQNNTLNYCGDFSNDNLSFLKNYFKLEEVNIKPYIVDEKLTSKNIIINNSFLCA